MTRIPGDVEAARIRAAFAQAFREQYRAAFTAGLRAERELAAEDASSTFSSSEAFAKAGLAFQDRERLQGRTISLREAYEYLLKAGRRP